MGWLIALGIVTLIAVLPVGIRLIYHEDGLFLSLLVGVLKIKLYPVETNKKEKKENLKQKKTTTSTAKKVSSKEPKKGGKLTDFFPLVEIALKFLGGLRRKLRISNLEMSLVMAADDPCDLAVNYGKAWAAVGNLLPLLEQIFVIKKRNIQVQCDFTGDHIRICFRGDVTITVGRLLSLVVVYGVKALREYLSIMKLRKGGTAK